MKIYHTETQADYDALMVELEAEGKTWRTGKKATENDIWNRFKNLTCVVVGKNINGFCYKEFYKEIAPDIPITKYKAKADEKMKFTKENVEKVIDEYFREADFESCGDLIAEVYDLNDTPEKVVVPKCFDEWYREIKGYWKSDSSAKQFALWKLCQQGFGHSFEDVRGRKISYASDLARWLRKNKMLAIDAVLNGYTIEPEQLYYIPLPDLETSDGLQQVLSKRDTYFASRPNEKLKQRFTKAELERVPEIYKPFAKPIEEETE